MALKQAFIAANRFGLGPRPGDLNRIAADPHRWLVGQLTPQRGLPASLRGKPSAAETVARFLEARRGGVKALRRMARRNFRQQWMDEVNARTQAMVRTDHPVVERLNAFWANHFTVSGRRFFVAPMVGAFEREAIRPHIFGKFEDMLHAAVFHQAMLLYLDNVRSIGPNSMGGRFGRRGLNENLAREVLELHTVGVDGGYTQRDVVEFAKMLTGWFLEGMRRRDPLTGKVIFLGIIHEPGDKTFMGQRIPGTGKSEAPEAIRRLARHPSTAKHIATKLARHFIADRPPAGAVRRLARTFMDTGGDLAAVYRTLIDLPEVWSSATPKVKTPVEVVVSTLRSLDFMEMPRRRRGYLPFFHALRQMPFMAPSPKGWPDTADAWLTPDLLMRRLRLIRLTAKLAARRVEPEDLFNTTIAPLSDAQARDVILGAGNRAEALALILASPAFQRR